MLWRVVFWIIVAAIGGCMIYYSTKLVDMLGRSKWADEKLWWTRQMWILLWFWGLVIWWLIMLWVISLSNPTDLGTRWL